MGQHTSRQHGRATGGSNDKVGGTVCRLYVPVRMTLKKLMVGQSLTHRGNILDDTDELIKDGLGSNVALIDGIAAADGLERIIGEILIGRLLPL